MIRKASAIIVAALLAVGFGLWPASAHATGVTGPCVSTVHENLDGVTPTAPAGAPGTAPTVELTAAGVKVSTRSFDSQGATWIRRLDRPLPLKEITRAAYTVIKHAHAVVPEAMPAMVLLIESPAEEAATLVYEPYGNPNDHSDAPPPLGRKTWNTAAGVWWTTNGPWPAGDFPEEGGNRVPNPHLGLSLAEVAAENRGALVVGFGWRQNWAQGLTATIADISLAGRDERGNRFCETHTWTKPRVTFTDDCDSTKITVEHTGRRGQWTVDITAGNFTATHKLNPGQRASEDFAATAGPITVTITKRGQQVGVWTHTWAAPRTGCASPSPTPSPQPTGSPTPPAGGGGGDGGGLPVTGPALPVLIGVGVALAALGAAVVVITRRRTTFTT